MVKFKENTLSHFQFFILISLAIHVLFVFRIPSDLTKFSFRNVRVPLENQVIDLVLAPQPKPKSKFKPLKTKTEKHVKKTQNQSPSQTTAQQQESPSSSKTRSQPMARARINASYPPLAEELGIEGSVNLKFLVNKDGLVSTVKIIESSGSKILDSAAKKAIKRAEFLPALDARGSPVASWGTQKINFVL